MTETELARKMLEKANSDNLPDDHEMRTCAIAFEEAAKGWLGQPQTCTIEKFLGCWARA